MSTKIEIPPHSANYRGRDRMKGFDMVYSTELFPSISLDEIKNNCEVTQTGCWVWQGTLRKRYATLTYNKRSFSVHRITTFLAHGEPPPGYFALHSCDNPPCVNPDHLRWGTHLENMADCVARNRRAITRGERNGRSKLDAKKVIAIRAIYGTGPTILEIADLYGISNQMVSRIIKREAWNHIA